MWRIHRSITSHDGQLTDFIYCIASGEDVETHKWSFSSWVGPSCQNRLIIVSQKWKQTFYFDSTQNVDDCEAEARTWTTRSPIDSSIIKKNYRLISLVVDYLSLDLWDIEVATFHIKTSKNVICLSKKNTNRPFFADFETSELKC